MTLGLRHGERTNFVRDYEVNPAVIVIITPGCAGAHILRKLRGPLSAEMLEFDSCALSDVCESDARIILRQIAREVRGYSFGILAGPIRLLRIPPTECCDRARDAKHEGAGRGKQQQASPPCQSHETNCRRLRGSSCDLQTAR